MTIIRENKKFIFNWYQKETNSTRILNYNSNSHLLQHKKSIIFNLIDRAIKLSDVRFHKQNINIVRQLLHENGYPNSFINNNIKKRMYIIKNNIHKQNFNTIYNRIEKIPLPFIK